MLEGKNVNLRVTEKEDLPLIAEWLNNPEFFGQYFAPLQRSKAEMEKRLEKNPLEIKTFIIDKKDGTKIGTMFHWLIGNLMEISCVLTSDERGKGYGTEATKLLVDYLFLSTNLIRIQAHTDARNMVSQKILQNVGFKKEGIIRKSVFARGEWRDRALLSILREEWKEPKILNRAVQNQ